MVTILTIPSLIAYQFRVLKGRQHSRNNKTFKGVSHAMQSSFSRGNFLPLFQIRKLGGGRDRSKMPCLEGMYIFTCNWKFTGEVNSNGKVTAWCSRGSLGERGEGQKGRGRKLEEQSSSVQKLGNELILLRKLQAFLLTFQKNFTHIV